MLICWFGQGCVPLTNNRVLVGAFVSSKTLSYFLNISVIHLFSLVFNLVAMVG
jgi:hypothetical protein